MITDYHMHTRTYHVYLFALFVCALSGDNEEDEQDEDEEEELDDDDEEEEEEKDNEYTTKMSPADRMFRALNQGIRMLSVHTHTRTH